MQLLSQCPTLWSSMDGSTSGFPVLHYRPECAQTHVHWTGFPCGSAGKESTCNAGDLGLIPGLGRSSGEGKGYPLQYSGLENSTDCIVHGVAKCGTRLSDFHFTSCPLRQWCHPTISSSVVSFSSFPSIRVFSNDSVLRIRWPKDWSFNLSISPSDKYSGLISFRIDWLDLFIVQETFKSLLQHHSSKASVLKHSAFFIVQLSHPYMTTGKTKPLTRRTVVGKVMSLLFNVLSRLVITFFPRKSVF